MDEAEHTSIRRHTNPSVPTAAELPRWRLQEGNNARAPPLPIAVRVFIREALVGKRWTRLDRRLHEELRHPWASSPSRPAGADQGFLPVWIPTTSSNCSLETGWTRQRSPDPEGMSTPSMGRRATSNTPMAPVHLRPAVCTAKPPVTRLPQRSPQSKWSLTRRVVAPNPGRHAHLFPEERAARAKPAAPSTAPSTTPGTHTGPASSMHTNAKLQIWPLQEMGGTHRTGQQPRLLPRPMGDRIPGPNPWGGHQDENQRRRPSRSSRTTGDEAGE